MNSLILKLFPNGHLGHRGDNCANGLSMKDEPENCTVIDTCSEATRTLGTQRHYLINYEGKLIHLRLCDAAKDSGYEAFAIILFTEGEYGCTARNITERFNCFKERSLCS